MLIDRFNYGFLLAPAETETAPAGTEDTTTDETTETTDTTEEGETEDSEESGETGEADLDDAGLEQAKLLYKSLLGPQRDSIIAALAQEAGLLRAPKAGETKAEEKKEVARETKAVQAILKEHLSEYPALADKLSGAIEEVVSQVRGEMTDKFESQQAQQIARDTDNALSKLRAKTKGDSDRFESKMAELANQLIKSDDVSIDTYVNQLYTIASAGSSKRTNANQIADKIRRNASNVSERTKGTVSNNRGEVKTTPAKKGLDAAVKFAYERLEKG